MKEIKFESKEIKEIFTEMLQETLNREKATLCKLESKIYNIEETEETKQIKETFKLYHQTIDTIEEHQDIISYGNPLRDLGYLLEQQYDLLFNTLLEMTGLEGFWEELEIQLKVNNEYIYSKNQTEEEIKQQVEKATDYLLSQEYAEEIGETELQFDYINR